jgi:hypothetical protein
MTRPARWYDFAAIGLLLAAILATLLLAPGTAHAKPHVTRRIIRKWAVRLHVRGRVRFERLSARIVRYEGNRCRRGATYWGPWQMNRTWHLTPHMRHAMRLGKRHAGRSWQLCPDYATARYVWAYKVGGYAAIHRGWPNTSRRAGL